MWGYEGEELQDIEETIAHVKRSDPDIFFTTVAYPIKGTPYYEQTAARLVQLKPWARSSDRELMLKGRPSRKFYECADSLLRDEVRLARMQAKNQADAQAEADLQIRIRATRAAMMSSFAEVEA
jgi:hypothetical protein